MEFRADKASSVVYNEVIIRNNDGLFSSQYKSYVSSYLMRIQ